jgi:hypothetical protein
VINLIGFKFRTNFLLLATLTVMDIILSGYKKKYRNNEAGSKKDNEASSSGEPVSKKLKCRK